MFNPAMIRAADAVLAGSTREDLTAAPLLDRWRVAISWAGHLSLSGTVLGHPGFRESEQITTSALVFIDPMQGIARTRSRWYRLGPQCEKKAGSPARRFSPEILDVQAFLRAQLVILEHARPGFEDR